MPSCNVTAASWANSSTRQTLTERTRTPVERRAPTTRAASPARRDRATCTGAASHRFSWLTDRIPSRTSVAVRAMSPAQSLGSGSGGPAAPGTGRASAARFSWAAAPDGESPTARNRTGSHIVVARARPGPAGGLLSGGRVAGPEGRPAGGWTARRAAGPLTTAPRPAR